jgi:hypothetical protein
MNIIEAFQEAIKGNKVRPVNGDRFYYFKNGIARQSIADTIATVPASFIIHSDGSPVEWEIIS